MELIQKYSQSRFQDFVLVLGMSVILALSAWISIRLPFTPVPVSLTAQLVLFFAAALGKRGAYATTLYLLQGAIGLPVFANGGCGLSYLMGPTGGYLLGFFVSAWVVALLVEKLGRKKPLQIFGLLLLGNSLIYLFGLPHLALYVGSANALKFGLLPFIAGDLLKLIVLQQSKRFFPSK